MNAELDETRKATERARRMPTSLSTPCASPWQYGQRAANRACQFRVLARSRSAPEKAEGQLLHEIDNGRWNIPELRRRLRDGERRAHDGRLRSTLELARQGRRVMSLNARKLPGDAERAELLLLAFNDVTVRAGITAGLVATNERKDEFLAMLGHELRHRSRRSRMRFTC